MTRVISISDNAYNELSKIKDGLSFSEIILSLTKCRKRDEIMNFAGALDSKEWTEIQKRLAEERKAKSRRA